MRSGIVYYRDRIAGRLLETDDGYEFTYLPEYLNDSSVPSISLTLPKRQEPYRSPHLFAFFSGLLAEGVQKDIQCRYLKIDENDEFGRLLLTSRLDCIGAVHVVPDAVERCAVGCAACADNDIGVKIRKHFALRR